MVPQLVSIIIPTYNRAHLLGHALASIRAQTYPHKQVIVVDDGSTDHTRQLVAAYPEVEYYYQANRRQAGARNTGLRYARGEYLASLDSDDVWEPDFLAKSVACLETHTLDFVFLNFEPGPGQRTHLSYLAQQPYWQRYLQQPAGDWWLLTPQLVRQVFLHSCPAPSSALLIRRSSLVGNWTEELLIADDWCLVLDMVINRACRAAFTLQPSWTKYRQHDNVYDGREQLQIVERLGLHDGALLAQRFAGHLTFRERLRMRRKLATEHLNYAYLLWKQQGISRQAIAAVQKAYRLAPARSTLHSLNYVWMYAVNRFRLPVR